MKKDILHSSILLVTLLISFIISKSPFVVYEIQLCALISALYIMVKKMKLRILPEGIIDSVVYVFVISLLINSTGGLTSPLFFLYYFLLFALSLLLEPNISITFTLGVITLFFVTTKHFSPIPHALPLISLPLMVPFALLLGGEYTKILLQKKQIEELEQVKKRLEKRMQEEKYSQNLFLSLVIKTHLKHMENLLTQTSHHIKHPLTKTLRRTEQLINRYQQAQ